LLFKELYVSPFDIDFARKKSAEFNCIECGHSLENPFPPLMEDDKEEVAIIRSKIFQLKIAIILSLKETKGEDIGRYDIGGDSVLYNKATLFRIHTGFWLERYME
jgi:hypothetical protein